MKSVKKVNAMLIDSLLKKNKIKKTLDYQKRKLKI